MIEKLECTQSKAQQNIDQLQNPTMRVAINNVSMTTEPSADPEGDRGSGPTLENHKLYGFL